MSLQPRTTIGSYRIHEEIASNAGAVVYRAWQRTTARWVALKVLRKTDPRALQAFRREIHLTANIGHPNVRQVYDAGLTPDGHPFLAMRFVETSLRQIVRSYQEQGRTFSPREVAYYLKPVADVLDCIHSKNIVHLDIKPENILLSRDGQVALADFGSARAVGSTTHEGTPRYFSPEQACGDRPVVPQSDVYSLAVVAYEMLAGQVPFGGGMDIVLARQHLEEDPLPLGRANPRLPRHLQKRIAAALSKDPEKRPVSAGALVDGIHLGEGRTSTGRRLGLQSRIGLWVLVLSAAVVLGILILATLLVVLVPILSPTATATPIPSHTHSPAISLLPTATATSIPTRTSTPTKALLPTATPRPTSTPTPTRPPPTRTPPPTSTSVARARGRQSGPAPITRSTVGRWRCSARLSQLAAPLSPVQGEAYG